MTVVPPPEPRLGWVDIVLVVVFLFGIYTTLTLPITSTIPLTCAPSGFAGLLLLWRMRDRLKPAHLAGLLLVIALFLLSILSASDLRFLGKRFTGWLQLTYSLVIGYALFVTLVNGERRQVANILLGFCIFIAVGCALEQYAGLRAVSDAVRERIYDARLVYAADLRDELFYGRVRPKLFTSEPSAVTFGYTHYAFMWLVVSAWRPRVKLLIYLIMMLIGIWLMPGPTLLLMLALAGPYIVLIIGRDWPDGVPSATRMLGGMAVAVVMVVGAFIVGTTVYSERFKKLSQGEDPSFFYRVVGPMLVAKEVVRIHPVAGAGLTAEPYIADDILNVFMNSSSFSSAWQFSRITDILTNYFWLHWIYLGAVWGLIMLAALSLWLRRLGVPSVLFCWAVFAILGQASGAYVGPKTWAVLLMAAAGAVLASRPPMPQQRAVRAGPYASVPALAAMSRARYGA